MCRPGQPGRTSCCSSSTAAACTCTALRVPGGTDTPKVSLLVPLLLCGAFHTALSYTCCTHHLCGFLVAEAACVCRRAKLKDICSFSTWYSTENGGAAPPAERVAGKAVRRSPPLHAMVVLGTGTYPRLLQKLEKSLSSFWHLWRWARTARL